uniref:Uncharacterized protein n=1 Tax=Mizugakiibacter sediminis TaxID=1475481 RepID=A0A0U1PAE1_9GAMM
MTTRSPTGASGFNERCGMCASGVGGFARSDPSLERGAGPAIPGRALAGARDALLCIASTRRLARTGTRTCSMSW